MISLPVLPSPPGGQLRGRALETSRPVLEGLKALTPGARTGGDCEVPALDSGEQYRFHFDMTRCIGCRCCEVACNEQNNNPAHVTWRRIGEVETGSYPHTRRFHVSMACNHCLDPTCLEGCPTDAYTKLSNGIVEHDPETCIGCQYCTWTCPYGVPQYHPERHVVTKCSFCAERLAEGQLPACVQACPTTAIEVEKVDIASWREALLDQSAPAGAHGLPDPRITLSTTRFTLPAKAPHMRTVEDVRELRPEAPHWPLVSLLVLTQASVGAFGAALALAIADASLHRTLCIVGWILALASLGASVFHLGRPIFAFRALSGWRHSWLSREAILFGVHAALASASAGAAWLDLLGPSGIEVLYSATLLAGALGVAASVMIYLLPARPAWNTWRTPVQFFATSVLLGASLALCASKLHGGISSSLLAAFAFVAMATALIDAALPWNFIRSASASRIPALTSSAMLLEEGFPRLLKARTVGLLVCTALFLAVGLVDRGPAWALLVAFLGALGTQIAGRFLFFVSVVPLDMPGHFFTRKEHH